MLPNRLIAQGQFQNCIYIQLVDCTKLNFTYQLYDDGRVRNDFRLNVTVRERERVKQSHKLRKLCCALLSDENFIAR